MSDNIMFSFLELTSSDFEFPIYRKSYSDETRNSGMFRYKLPTSQVRDDYDVYAVSFTPADGCTQFICNSHDNIHLTKKWILDGLIAKANSTFSSDKYFVEQGFIHYISFIIATYKEGLRVIQVEPYYLEKNNSFGFILDFKFKANKGYEKTRQEKMLSLSLAADGSKNKNYYSDKLKYITAFIANTLSKIYPIEIDTVSIDVKRTLTDISSFLLDEKVYIFNNGEGTVQFQGIKEYKPLNSVSDNPLFIFVFEKSKVNTARQLVKALRGQLYTTFSGMEDMFGVKFDNDNIQSIIVDNYSKESLSYIEACIDNIVRENQTAQIAGVFAGIEKDFDTDKDYSPYYAVKSYFLKHGLAIQAVTIEQALKRDGFKWSISGIALQLFVKLGGQPWKVKPQQENCLIFGISSAHIKDSENKTTKYFAYSLCFDSSGIYKRLNILGQSTDEKTYIEQLAERIKASLSNEIGSDISKCVVHVPYKLKRTEMKCIRDSVNAVKADHKDIEFSVIKININNKFFGYSHFNSCIPLAGSGVQLGKYEYLVWFEGLQQGKTQVVSAQNISNPVHIQFLDCPELTDEEVKAYLQDIINLSGANWRGFNAKHEPVTTLYPELIAKFAGKFDQYGLDMVIGDTAMDKVWFI
jgi:hypothetical protein